MNQYLIMTDFNNEFGDLTYIRADSFDEAIDIFKKKRKEDKWVIEEYFREENDDCEELMNWKIDEQNPDYHKYYNRRGITIVIYKIPNESYNLIGKYHWNDHDMFGFLHNGNIL